MAATGGAEMSGTVSRPDARLLPGRQAEAERMLAALLRGLAFVALLLGALVLIWHALIVTLAVPAYVAPSPQAVWTTLTGEWPRLSQALWFTLRSTLGGMAIALVLALVLAGLFTLSDLLSRAFLPLIVILRTAPILAIAPLLILIFGRGQATSVAVVVMVSFFPMMVNAARGFRSPKANVLELMHVCGADWWQIFLKVRLPFALPYIFTGIRMAAAGAVLSAMLAEWLSGAPGLGTLILEASSFRRLPLMWAGVVLSMAAATTLFFLTVQLERRMTR